MAPGKRERGGKGKKAQGALGQRTAKGGAFLPGDRKRKRRGKKFEKWSAYIHKVLKEVHPNLGISTRGMKIMNSFSEDMFDRIHNEAIALSKLNRARTLSARELQTASRLLLPGELAKHAMSEGTKAVAKYSASIVQERTEARDEE